MFYHSKFQHYLNLYCTHKHIFIELFKQQQNIPSLCNLGNNLVLFSMPQFQKYLLRCLSVSLCVCVSLSQSVLLITHFKDTLTVQVYLEFYINFPSYLELYIQCPHKVNTLAVFLNITQWHGYKMVQGKSLLFLYCKTTI
jgi:hypothetical protein